MRAMKKGKVTRIKMATETTDRVRQRGRERLRDVSVTADCADIDPSLVPSPQETERNTRTRDAIAEQKRWKE